MGYTKLFQRIITSSIWDESAETKVVWVTMLAMADQNGYVGATVKSLSLFSRVSEVACLKALEVFMSPDSQSRTRDNDGLRIEKAEGGWFILNHKKYRDATSDDPTAVAARERQRRYRMKHAQEPQTIGARSQQGPDEDSGEEAPTDVTQTPAGEEESYHCDNLNARVGKYAPLVQQVMVARPEFEQMIPEDIAAEIIKAEQVGVSGWAENVIEFCRDCANATESPRSPLSLFRKYINNQKKGVAKQGGYKSAL